MTRHEYDEEASEHLHMDVVHEIDDRPAAESSWVDARRRLNAIDDPLARKILALHRDCGSGTGECDSSLDEMPVASSADWGCETTALVATHFGVAYPAGADS
jgi:hypothetical protein